MSLRLGLCAILVALVAAPSASAAGGVERGIVQSLDATTVVLRALDGSDVSVPLAPTTRYRLNGRAAGPAEILPGFVAEAVRGAAGTAVVVRAFGRAAERTESGVLVRQRAGALVLRRTTGERVRVPLTARTAVWRGGRRVARRALRPGLRLDVVLAADGTARVVLVQRAGAA